MSKRRIGLLAAVSIGAVFTALAPAGPAHAQVGVYEKVVPNCSAISVAQSCSAVAQPEQIVGNDFYYELNCEAVVHGVVDASRVHCYLLGEDGSIYGSTTGNSTPNSPEVASASNSSFHIPLMLIPIQKYSVCVQAGMTYTGRTYQLSDPFCSPF